MGYWGIIASRAAAETRGEVRWDSPVRVSIAVVAVASSTMATWAFTHQAAYCAGAAVAALVAVALLTFVWKLVTVPAALHDEQLARFEKLAARLQGEDYHRRQIMIYNLTNLYIAENPDGRIAEMQYGVAYPPEDWLNRRLADYGERWAVSISGANVQFIELL
jgi:hypothetical protein